MLPHVGDIDVMKAYTRSSIGLTPDLVIPAGQYAIPAQFHSYVKVYDSLLLCTQRYVTY